MKKLLVLLVVVMLTLSVLLVGCGGTVTPPTDEEPSAEILALIEEYIGTNNIQRWPNGTVMVFDSTGETKEIWDEVNAIIKGGTVFELTNNSAAAIGIEYQPVEGVFLVGFPYMSNNEFEMCGAMINETTASNEVFVGAVLIAIGIHPDKWKEGFTDEMKKVIYWLYKLEPGYPLS